MRVSKRNSTANVGTAYPYDGQMGFEDADYTGSTVNATNDYGIGARGIDYIARTSSGTTTVGFPIYDAHGNMVATLSRSGGGYAVNNQRYYDAWGSIRQGAATGDPKGRYCANLGHKQDDESGLVYMRARYYEAGSGRFLTEDSGRVGRCWFAYCGNNPIGFTDRSGQTYGAEMDDLMEQLEQIMSQGLPADIAVFRIGQLMTSMGIYIGLARSEALEHWESAEILAGVGSVEGAKMEQAAALKSNAEAVVGLIYEGEMALAILMVTMRDD